MQVTHPPEGSILAARQARRRRRRLRWAALLVAVTAVVAVVVAIQTDPSRTSAAVDPDNLGVGPPMPELAASGWLNSEPLSGDDLAGQVVVYDFWTYSCVNCVRTIPYLRAWHERYERDGLLIVGVHSPEFRFERERPNVEAAVDRLGVAWPVALDPEGNIWDAFEVRAWPSKYVTDREGRLRYVHIGEGRYQETEAVIRKLLGLPEGAPRAEPPPSGSGGDGTDDGVTGETHLGTRRGEAAVDGLHDYGADPPSPDLGEVQLSGRWDGDPERISAAAAGATLALSYRAREVNLVMAAGGDAVDVVLELDGFPVPEGLRTPQTQIDAEGRTFVRVDNADLYRLVRGESGGRHVLRLTPQATGLEAFAFTFG